MTSIASFDHNLLLEVRTEAGVVYLCPSRLERMRLQWTFRHFRILPPNLLSRHDQRLIEKLSQSAVVTPALPVASYDILGVVEMPKAKSPSHAPARGLAAGGVPRREDRLPRWGAISAVAASAIGIILLAIAMRAVLRRAPALPVAQAASQNQPVAVQPATTSLMAAPLVSAPDVAETAWPPAPQRLSTPAVNKPAPVVAAEPAAATEAVAGERRWVAELPQGHFARPVVTQQSLAGEVRLKALIAPDGSVQQVTVVSGNPKLAEAGMRAVRQWRYSPYQAQGAAAEEQAQIKMDFFGPDAVSIASVANQP